MRMIGLVSVGLIAVGCACVGGVSQEAATQDSRRFGVGEPAKRPDGTIRLATYNVLNLFDREDDPTLVGRNDDFDDAKPLDELEALAATIGRMDADVVALQEIESKSALEWFRDEYLDGMGYEYIESIDAGDRRGIENAVMSRYPLEDAVNWPGLPLGGVHPKKWGNEENYNAGRPLLFRRSPLRVTVRVPGEEDAEDYRLTLFVVHHKSGRHGGYWREAEAKKVVELVRDYESRNKDANVIVLGDFNCRKSDEPYSVYKRAGFVDPTEQKGDADPVWVTHESGRMIDYVLSNAGAAREYVPQSVFVLGTPARPEGANWRTTAPPKGYASDHYPVVIDLIPRDR